MKIVLDAVFNHCSEDFPLFIDAKERKEESPYYHWFIFMKMIMRLLLIAPICQNLIQKTQMFKIIFRNYRILDERVSYRWLALRCLR